MTFIKQLSLSIQEIHICYKKSRPINTKYKLKQS